MRGGLCCAYNKTNVLRIMPQSPNSHFQRGIVERKKPNRMAERVGFEPTIPVKVCPLSRRIVSTAHAPLRVKKLSAVEVSAKADSSLRSE